MIDGLRLQVEHGELSNLLRNRAEYHQQRAQVKEGELPKLQSALESIKKVEPSKNHVQMSSSGYRSNSDLDHQIDSLKEDIKTHKNKVHYFNFLADHLFEDVYSLKEDELIKLELVRR